MECFAKKGMVAFQILFSEKFKINRKELGFLLSNIGFQKNLKKYNLAMVTEFQAITTSGTIISYALYTIEKNDWLLLTVPHVLYGVFRYIYLVTEFNEGGAPDETLLKDRPILLTGVLYVLTVFAVLIFAPLPPS